MRHALPYVWIYTGIKDFFIFQPWYISNWRVLRVRVSIYLATKEPRVLLAMQQQQPRITQPKNIVEHKL